MRPKIEKKLFEMKVKGSVPGLMTLMAMPMKNVKGYFNLFFLTTFIFVT